MNNTAKSNILAVLLALTPIYMGAVATIWSNPAYDFILNGIYALVAIVVFAFVSDLRSFDQGFLERVNSLSSIAILIVSISGSYAIMVNVTPLVWFFLPLTFGSTLYFLVRHFDIKNISILLINLYVAWINVLGLSSVALMLITMAAIMIYTIRAVLIRSIAFRYTVFITYVLTFLLIMTTFGVESPETDLLLVHYVWTSPILLTILISLLIVYAQEKPRINVRVVVALLGLLILEQVAVLISKLQFNATMMLITFIYGVAILQIYGNTTFKNTHPKVSIIIPVHNSSATIVAAMQSVIDQKYSNWEVLVMDAGSTDDTEIIVRRFISNNRYPIYYHYQEDDNINKAIKNSLHYLKGEVIFVLDSHATFYNSNSILYAVNALTSELTDGVFVNTQVDINNKFKKLIVKPYYRNYNNLVKAALLYGRDPYPNTIFWRRKTYEEYVNKNYLTDCLPSWYNAKSHHALRLSNGNFMGIKFSNYLPKTTIDPLSQLRFLHSLLANIKIPAFKVQASLFNILNKLGLATIAPVVAYRGHTSLKETIKVQNNTNQYLQSIIAFGQNYDINKTASVKLPANLEIYNGLDVDEFNRKFKNHELDPFYFEFLKLLGTGIAKIKAATADQEKLAAILEFFTVRDYITIEEEK